MRVAEVVVSAFVKKDWNVISVQIDNYFWWHWIVVFWLFSASSTYNSETRQARQLNKTSSDPTAKKQAQACRADKTSSRKWPRAKDVDVLLLVDHHQCD